MDKNNDDNMSQVGINLDDIFPASVTATNNGYNEKPASEVHSRNNSVVKTASRGNTVTESIPPEPKSRATTAVSERSSSTLVGNNAVTTTHAAATVHHEENVSRKFTGGTVDTQNFMDQIFSTVALPEVHYSTNDYSSSTAHNVESHHESHHTDYHHAVGHIDDVLAGEDYENEGSVVSEHQPPASYVASSHISTAKSYHSTASKVPSQVVAASDPYASSHVSSATITSKENAVAEVVVDALTRQIFADLALDDLRNGAYEGEDYVKQPLYENNGGQHSEFEPAHLPFSATKSQAMRPRTMTVDSSVSYAESRFGGFNVHNDNDEFENSEINLHSDEVAYMRPKKSAVSSPPMPRAPEPIHTGGTIKLQQLQNEVVMARQHETELALRVERERHEVERLRQQSLAKQAAIKVNQLGSGASVQHSYQRSTASSASSIGGSSMHSPVAPPSADYHHHHHHRSISGDEIYEEEITPVSEIAELHRSSGHVIGKIDKYDLIIPQQEELHGYSKNHNIRKVFLGGRAPQTEDDKTVLLFGPVGSGKTSAIQSMINYLYDVKKEYPFRFVLEEQSAPTHGLTAYVISNSILPFNVTIIDTPGVVNEKGNMDVSTLIKTWFEQELLQAGSFRLDAISIVLRHDEDSLGWPFIYELAAVKKMFGDDLKTNVLPIITNSEVLPQPIAIRSLAQANIAFVEYYKVNNLGFFPQAQGIKKLKHKLFFDHGVASLEAYFRDLQELIHPLLAVLRRTHHEHNGH